MTRPQREDLGGAVRTVEDLSSGDHACWIYSGDDEHRRVLTAFLDRGLANGEKVVYFGTGQESAILAHLVALGRDVDALRADGRLAVGRAEQVYAPGGEFDPDARMADYRLMVERAVVEGHRGLRVCAEAAWMLGDRSVREHWAAYELRAGLLARRLPFTALCAYDSRLCDEEALDLMECVHPVRIGADRRSAALFHLHGTDDGGIGIQGEVDLSNARLVRSILSAALGDAEKPVLDLSSLEFVDVAGVRAIGEVVDHGAPGRGPVELRGAPSTFERIWELMRRENDRLVG